MGRGAISVYTLITRLLKHRQEGTYNAYEKEFRDLVLNLRAQRNADQVLEMIIKTLFILGLNKEKLKKLLSPTYGRREWPCMA
jgi:hypothetical protein